MKKSKKDSKDQESIQSSTTPVQGYQMGNSHCSIHSCRTGSGVVLDFIDS